MKIYNKQLHRTVPIILLSIILVNCHKIDLIKPPTDGGASASFTGRGSFKSMLMLENRILSSNVLPDEQDSWIIGSDPTVYYRSSTFGKPETNISVDLPYLKSDAIPGLILQPVSQGMKTVDYPGAFGTTADAGWHVGSNWFRLNPYDNDYGDPAGAIPVSGEINADITWVSTNRYLIVGQVFVNSGYTLTIEPGTVIYGSGSPNAGVLVINRGAKIIARGTPDLPIVFTSMKSGKNRNRGDWGGLVLCGKAPNNKGDNVIVEGITSGSNGDGGKFGGTDPNDNSGELSFCRFEFGGIAIGPGNEVNGVTFGSIGSATVLHNIIVSDQGDDGMEWFGGTVNCSYFASYDVLDDDCDVDQGYSGLIQFAYFLRNAYAADVSLSGSIEASSSKTTGSQPITTCQFANVTTVGPIWLVGNVGFDPNSQGGVRVNNDAYTQIYNSVIIGWPTGAMNN